MNIATHTYSVEEIVSLLKSKKWQDDNLIPIINNPHFKTENWYFDVEKPMGVVVKFISTEGLISVDLMDFIRAVEPYSELEYYHISGEIGELNNLTSHIAGKIVASRLACPENLFEKCWTEILPQIISNSCGYNDIEHTYSLSDRFTWEVFTCNTKHK